jgi:hypothetical protein
VFKEVLRLISLIEPEFSDEGETEVSEDTAAIDLLGTFQQFFNLWPTFWQNKHLFAALSLALRLRFPLNGPLKSSEMKAVLGIVEGEGEGVSLLKDGLGIGFWFERIGRIGIRGVEGDGIEVGLIEVGYVVPKSSKIIGNVLRRNDSEPIDEKFRETDFIE